jgi:N-formylglutamate deformylase
MNLYMDKTYHFHRGNSPMLISIPHAGTMLPKDIYSRLTPKAKQLADVDWHLPILYDIAKGFDISILEAEYARYAIDLNRSPENSSLYPGQDVTGLCPIDTFAKQPIYLNGKQPNAKEISNRIEKYWMPYHKKLETELKRIRALHGIAILWDAHSIASHVPRFFTGKLPDLNFGTADLKSCDATLQEALATTMHHSVYAKKYSHVFNGRFKGGYITRHYGVPSINIHAVQLEISQCIYMEEMPPYKYNAELAINLKSLLVDLLNTCLNWANEHKNL